jgi:anion-transporting  ArsA/GET3 family ATPase
VIDGFGQRTRDVEALLRAPETSFLIVTSPEPEPAGEALFLAERLASANMSADALIINRTHLGGLDGHAAEEVASLLAAELGEQLAERVASNLADFDVLARRDSESIERLTTGLGGTAPTVVPQLDEDVQDLLGLARVAEYLFQ